VHCSLYQTQIAGKKNPTHQHLKTYKYQGKINKTEQEILRVNFE